MTNFEAALLGSNVALLIMTIMHSHQIRKLEKFQDAVFPIIDAIVKDWNTKDA